MDNIKKIAMQIWDKIEITKEPIIIFIVIVIIVSFFIIYDRDNENPKIIDSFTRTFRKFFILVVDLLGDTVSLFSSLAEVLNLIRILIFGKIDSQTQIYLANYAIIFMSVVSYFTTMNGLTLVLEDWQAILASFGIQVGILVFSGRLAKKMSGTWNKEAEKKYVYIEYIKSLQFRGIPALIDIKNVKNIYSNTGKSVGDVAEESIIELLEAEISKDSSRTTDEMDNNEKVIHMVEKLEKKIDYILPGQKKIILNILRKAYK